MTNTLDTLIERILAKLHELNLSEREASIDATGKADTIRNITKRRSMPGVDRLEQIARTLNTSPDWLLGREGAIERVDGQQPIISLDALRSLPKNLPVYGTALGADISFDGLAGEIVAVEQTDVMMVSAMDYMARPTGIAGRKDVYVVIVAGHSMEPRFDAGRRVLVEGKRQPLIGEDVIVQLRAPIDDGEEVTHVLIKQLVQRKSSGVVLRQFNPEVVFEVPAERVHALHRIMPWDEALGF
jgi:phage repressor protein C with HTH and peptisase S24 domain